MNFTNLTNLYSLYQQHPLISTDSRHIKAGSLFFALKGANFDGNRFAQEALQKGAVYAIIDNPAYATGEHFLLVQDVLTTLQALAQQHRQSLNIPVVAVGGSNGKTTTKELIYRVLSQKYKTFATLGNLNNHIGVPLSILAIPPQTEIAVIEIGANHLHETYTLCQIAQPTHGVVTNVGSDHLEGFGSVEGVAQANAEMYQYLHENKGLAFVNTQEAYLSDLIKKYANLQVYTYPKVGDNYQVELLASDFFVKIRSQQGEVYTCQLFGQYNFPNIATALCIGNYFGVSSALMYEAVATYTPSNMRSQVLHRGSNTIILDAYNANPSSMEQALYAFAQIPVQKKAVILGNMNELGSAAAAEHQKLGQFLQKIPLDVILLVGEDMIHALPYVPQAYYFNDKFSLHNWLQDHPFKETYVLIKGSRSWQLESAMQCL